MRINNLQTGFSRIFPARKISCIRIYGNYWKYRGGGERREKITKEYKEKSSKDI